MVVHGGNATTAVMVDAIPRPQVNCLAAGGRNGHSLKK